MTKNNKTNKGYGIGINKDGYLELVVGDGKEVDYLVSELPLVKKVWFPRVKSYLSSSIPAAPP